MFQKVDEARFVDGEHEMLRFWQEQNVFHQLLQKNAAGPKWSFLDGPITANNPMGVHHAWGRTYKDAYQRYRAMTGHELRYQNGFDCQGLWVEVEVEKEMGLGTKTAIAEHGIDKFVHECKKRVLTFAARQTEQSIRLGYWMEWDDPEELRKLASHIGKESRVQSPESSETETSVNRLDTGHSTLDYVNARGDTVTGTAEEITARLGNPNWGGSYFTFSTENNETIWTFLKKCFDRGKIFLGHDVMPWGGRAGSAYSQMEIADGRKLTTHRSCFVRFPLIEEKEDGTTEARRHGGLKQYLLVWTTTPWTLTSNVAAAVNPDLTYVRLKAQIPGDDEPAYYLFAQDNLYYKRLDSEFKDGFGRPEWSWPDGVPKLKVIAQIFKERGGWKVDDSDNISGNEMVGWRYAGPFDDLEAQQHRVEEPEHPVVKVFNRTPFILDKQALFGGTFSDHWEPVLQDATNESVTTGVDVLRKRVEACFQYLHDMTISSATPLDYEHWSGRTRLDYALREAGVLGVVDQFSDRLAHLADELVNFIAYTPIDPTNDSHPIEEVKRIDAFESIQTADALMSMGRELFAELQMAFHTYEQQTRFLESKSSAETHRVINGGRDFKGNPHVVAGEGTGIVHIAPGCGDVDHKIGENRKLAVIAPLKEDGSFGEGFGPFTGRTAVDPKTADLVFEQLKEKGRLVYVEEYPHIYPHCWRTGEELVFRLVDEWFINMDWREEIKEVTKAITWLPDSIQGQEREIEWLSTMRDWMISKKRFWGLALPIWVNPDDASDFEVIGSLAELKERAVEGWEEFEGHTPHRPWIDKVKIKSEKTGAVLTRVEDVGNPWLDAGITPFSTMNYRAWKESSVQSPVSSEDGGASTLDTGHSTLDWSDWYPADFVTECFPGQFRNWFYSLLALSTMMRYDETDDPAEKRPFKTLLGHRLVMDEHGNPMHKSDGTAIWFEEAAEQLGVDTLRWMYLAQNPASDLRFGTRHPDEPVTLSTPEGPISETKEGLPTCKVTSKPADEIRRQVLIPLWNSYAFFVNYAVADEFDPTLEPVPLAERPEIDRWILSRLQELIGTAHDSFRAYDVARFMAAATTYIDDLSNWYIRRNRRRFWRSKDASDSDKTAAYQTLHEVLLTLTKLLAPSIPFLAERMYQNLASGGRQSPVTQDEAGAGEVDGALNKQGVDTPRSPGSVHLCDYPTVDESKLDPALNRKTAAVQTLVRLAHRLRETAELRVRQPLAELQFAANDAEIAAALEQSADIIADELNVKTVTRAEHLDELVSYAYKPNLKTLGPKYGKLLGAIRKELPEMEGALLAPLRNGKPVTVTLGGEEVTLEPDDVLVSTEQASDWASGDDAGIQVALSTALTPELLREGMARDFVRHVQQARKDAGLEITDRIQVQASVDEPEAKQAIEEWATYIQNETLADAIKSMDSGHTGKRVAVGPVMINIRVVPVTLKK